MQANRFLSPQLLVPSLALHDLTQATIASHALEAIRSKVCLKTWKMMNF
jgi:hypothetical protein